VAILSLTEYKALPSYQASHGDALITQLIPEVEADYLAIRGLDWRRATGDIANGSKTVSTVSTFVGIEVGQLVDGTGVRGVIVSMDRDSGTIELDTAATADATGEALTVYPQAVRLTAARMLVFQINEGLRDSALSGESIEKHTTSADADRIMGYPKAIVGGIRRYGDVA